jgi:hypothetical protein
MSRQDRKRSWLKWLITITILVVLSVGIWSGLRGYTYSDWWLQVSCPDLTAAIPFTLDQDGAIVSGEGTSTFCYGVDCWHGWAKVYGEFRPWRLGFDLDGVNVAVSDDEGPEMDLFAQRRYAEIAGLLHTGLGYQHYERGFDSVRLADLVAVPGFTRSSGVCSIVLNRGLMP